MSKYIPAATEGEKCRICKKPAYHKLEEVIFDDEPVPERMTKDSIPSEILDKMIGGVRHPHTAYVCCIHFQLIMGLSAKQYCIDNEHEWTKL